MDMNINQRCLRKAFCAVAVFTGLTFHLFKFEDFFTTHKKRYKNQNGFVDLNRIFFYKRKFDKIAKE